MQNEMTYTQLAEQLGVSTNELKDAVNVGRSTNNTLVVPDDKVTLARTAFPAEEAPEAVVEEAPAAEVDPEEAPAAEVDPEEAGGEPDTRPLPEEE